jgi:hypothetical protein
MGLQGLADIDLFPGDLVTHVSSCADFLFLRATDRVSSLCRGG